MQFDRFDAADHRRCVFTASPKIEKAHHADTEKRFLTLRRRVERYLGDHVGADEDGGAHFERSPYVIRVKRTANDIELPGLRYDCRNREISFLWCEMFMHLYREEAVVERRLDKCMQLRLCQESTHDMPPVLTQIRSWNKERDKIRKSVCRTRVHLWYSEHINNQIYECRADSIGRAMETCFENVERVRIDCHDIQFLEDDDEKRLHLAQEIEEAEGNGGKVKRRRRKIL